MKHLTNSICCLSFSFLISTSCCAVDATNVAKIIYESGGWKVVEIAGQSKMLYRIATDSINIKDTHLTIDFISQCKADSVVMVKKFQEYNPILNNGKLILQYRIPDAYENQEIVDTEMSQGDSYAFFKFSKLRADNFYIAKETSRLAIWVPESGDGHVKKSSNFYFSLEGFRSVYTKAKSLCQTNS
jgi:hypothetical protein